MTPKSAAPQSVDARVVGRAKPTNDSTGIQPRAYVFFADEIRTRWERIVAR